MKKKALIYIILTAIVGGSTATITKIGLREIPPLNLVFFRFLISTLVVIPFFLKYEKNFKENLIDTIKISLFGSFNVLFFILGIGKTTATSSQILYSAVPLISVILVFLLHGERITSQKIYGVFIGFIGVVIILLLPAITGNLAFKGSLIGNLAISFGVVSWSSYLFFSKKLLKFKNPFLITCYLIFTTTLLFIPLSIYETRGNYSWLSNISITGMLSVLYIALFSTIATFILNQYAIKYGGVIMASTLYYLLPVVAFLSAFFLLGEKLTIGILIGAVLAMFGVYLVSKN